MRNSPPRGRNYVSVATRDLWERLFDEGYKADVFINTDNGGIIYAHSYIIVSSVHSDLCCTKMMFHLIFAPAL